MLSKFVHARTREVLCQSTLQHLFCPNSITESIGTNIQFFCKNEYMVHDAYAITGTRFRPFQGRRNIIHDSFQDRYLESILFLDAAFCYAHVTAVSR
jgi:hypothetical protein